MDEKDLTLQQRKKLLGKGLKAARKRAMYWCERKKHPAMTQARAAKALGVSQSYLSKIESGAQVPSFLEVEWLAAFYGRELWQLRTLKEKEQRKSLHYLHRR
jgi:transcriptional regulator with XRE-family HTH domain